MTKLSKILKSARQKSGLSLRELAQESGLSHAHIWEMETGKQANPAVSTIRDLAKVLKINPIDIFKAAL